jgi:hypothetical protein
MSVNLGDDILNEKKLHSQLRKMLHTAKKEKHEHKHKIKSKLRHIKRKIELVNQKTWLPTATNADAANNTGGSISNTLSRRLTTDEIEEARAHALNKLRTTEQRLMSQIYTKTAQEYFTNIHQSHREGKIKVENRKVRASKAYTKRERQKAVEKRPYVKHDVTWKMKTNAGNIIMRKFEGNGPSPESDMPVLKEGTEIWPVLPDRFGGGRLPGKPSWYRTQNGNLFGDQELENFPTQYKTQVIKNARIKKNNDRIKKEREAKRLAIQTVHDLRTKPKRPWSASGGGRVFSMLTSIRPPTAIERRKINALPSRALAGHTIGSNPKWKCR